MHLQISPDAPAVVQIAAASLLALHIGGAAVGLVSGGAAMVFRKGGRLHRAAGNVFFVAMLTMSGVGAAVAPFLPEDQVPNTMVGLFTFYLVATAWATVKRGPGRTGRFEVAAVSLALGAAAAGVALAWASAHSAHPLPQPQGTVLYIFAAVATLAAASDISVIRRGGLSGTPRITRHLWRMSTALLIAAGSAGGQPKVIPHFLRGSPITLLPMFVVLVAMIYWLIRMRTPSAATVARGQAAVFGLPTMPR